MWVKNRNKYGINAIGKESEQRQRCICIVIG
jgi:hypothetical protein